MNLELPFDALSDAELDAYLARIDHELDVLFLDEVAHVLAELAKDGLTPAGDSAAA